MTYDLNDVELPALRGWPLRAAAALLDTPGVSAPLLQVLLARGGMHAARRRRVDAAPAATPVWPAAAFSAHDVAQAATAPAAPPMRGFAAPRIADFALRYRAGSWSPERVAERFLAVAMDTTLNAFISVDPADVRAQAQQSTARWRAGQPLGPLDGVPIAVKDELDQPPHRTTDGTRVRRPAPPQDAVVVARLRAQGALLVGKTNMHEIGIQPNGLNTHYGVARNPFNTAHDSGGSSSGSAVAVAAGLCPVAIGADGGGSIRIPAALCGQVGLKATFGAVSAAGAVPLCPSVAHIGPIAGCVADAAQVFAVIAETSMRGMADARPWHMGRVQGLRLGIFRPWYTHADAALVQACDTVLQAAQQAGATLHEVDIADLEMLRVAHNITILYEMAAGLRAFMPDTHDLASSVRVLLAAARALRPADYAWAQRVRAQAMAAWAQLFTQVDMLVTPATGTTAAVLPAATDWLDVTTATRYMRFALPANLLGLPSLALPVGYNAAGLPLGMQLTGPAWHEHVLFSMATFVESVVERRRPTTFFDLLAD